MVTTDPTGRRVEAPEPHPPFVAFGCVGLGGVRGCPVDLRRRTRRPDDDRRRCRRRRYNPGIDSSSALPDAAWIAVCIHQDPRDTP